ncbi:MAG: nickel/cobalt transporter (NicO) family protein [Frankiaceae bacterium]|jgi:ABC-type nickel/cobalt efflux system permease component RcnA|nr:nickel/cobalt transporter (NicO) family protein [Frankiaceae bacterium]
MKRFAVVGLVTAALVVGPAVAASAHPLGNFTVNHYDGLTLRSDRVDVLSVVDSAEIPTTQARSSVDANHDGVLGAAERQRYAGRMCVDVVRHLSLSVDGMATTLSGMSSSYQLRPGAAGLPTSRLVCTSFARSDLAAGRTQVGFTDGYRSDRIGWRELTAVGRGVHLDRSPVPAMSVSDQLLHYPNDLLSSPLDVRTATFSVLPGDGLSTFARGIAAVPGAGPVARLVERLNRTFSGLAGARHLTLGVGLLAVLVSLLLGASHAALPGHGKTVMAAYLAGKRGTVRDAVVVGATVTATHTAGVLVLGLALTASSSLAGDRVLGDLGIVSGLLVATIGVGLLTSAIRRRRAHRDHEHEHEHGHEHDHGHDHGHEPGHGHGHPRPQRLGRAGLVGMGVAGGLVPSPSALVVLLGAVALGRTVFGVVLVLTYGIGMAATLTGAGLLAVRLSDRWSGRLARLRLARRLTAATPLVTGGLVVAVGLGLAARSFAVI